MRTGENVTELGLYVSVCCGKDWIFDKQDVFHRCPQCECLCEWELTERLIDWNQLERVAA
jgi:hypothetical protein